MNFDEKARQELKNFVDNIWDIILLNMLFVLSCIPVVTFGTALGALYSSVSSLKQKRSRGGAAAMYWSAFKAGFKPITPFWLILLAATAVLFFDFGLTEASDGFGKYAYYGALLFAALLIQTFVTVGIPIISAGGRVKKQIVAESAAVLSERPVRTLLACMLNVLPLVVLFTSSKIFTELFLVWMCLYFSLAELAVYAMLGDIIRDVIS